VLNPLHFKFVKYLLVGVMNTAFGYSLYALFIFLNMHYSAALLLSTLLGVLFNFKTIGRLVFKNGRNDLIFRFVAVYAVTYLLNVSGLRIFSSYGFNMYSAGALLLIPVTVISFLLHNTVVFKESVLNAAN